MAKIQNIINNNGNAAANQFVITTDKGIYFQSYNSVVAFWDGLNRRLKVTPLWDYSATTRKHFYIFLNDYTNIFADRKNVLSKIKDGSIEVIEDGKLDF